MRLKEHRSDVKFHRTSNALVLHIEKYGHLPDWDNTRILEKNMKKSTRKMLEAAHIITRKTCNSRCGFITWSSMAAEIRCWIGVDKQKEHEIRDTEILDGFAKFLIHSYCDCVCNTYTVIRTVIKVQWNRKLCAHK